MRALRTISIFALLFALSLWGVFGYLVWTLPSERSAYAAAIVTADENALRGESLSRLRAAVRDTENERAALGNLLNLTILRAVEILETTGKQAGATNVSIGEATPLPAAKTDPKGLSTISVVVNLEGSFAALMRAVNLYETLAIPASFEQFEMEKIESSWRMTARFKIFLLPLTP
ncbi:MAG: hypothetical protein WAZ27_00195 [Minisyncoccia bacterium]